MRQLNGTYAQAFNRSRGRVGHVFEGRYGAVLVESERHLLQLSRYVGSQPCPRTALPATGGVALEQLQGNDRGRTCTGFTHG